MLFRFRIGHRTISIALDPSDPPNMERDPPMLSIVYGRARVTEYPLIEVRMGVDGCFATLVNTRAQEVAIMDLSRFSGEGAGLRGVFVSQSERRGWV
mmetsp:Transcript_21320/g.21633  ORF Transcript_21320/g.21633 Transcript_21320/m.21633 type:complete len:97 (-) Transcript_21320:9-299(-)